MEYKHSKESTVTYVVAKAYVRVVGDGQHIPYTRIPETVKDWAEPMKSEMIGFYEDRFPMVECEVCGKPFRKIRHAVTCSPACSHARANAKAEEIVECDCTVCGKTFTKRRHQQKYTCSPQCTKEFGKAHQGTIDRTKKKKKKDQIVKIEKDARKKGLHYADIQKQKTLAMVGGVKL